MVQDAAGASVAPRLRPALALVLALTLAALAGCSSDSPQNGAPSPGGAERIGTPVRLANCRDWEKATLRQRFGTVRELRSVLGRPVGGEGGATGRTLDDRQAFDLFDNACKQSFAKGFKLYKIYSRAAAFSQRRPRGQ